MKRFTYLSFLLLFTLILFNACTKNEETDLSALSTDELQLRDIDPQPALDLSISSITTTLPVNNTPCGDNFSDAVCGGSGGATQTNFLATIVVENNSNVAIPAGDLVQIRLELFDPQNPGGGIILNRFDGIPANGSLTVISPNLSFACPTGPGPYQLITEQLFAEVDPNNDYAENNESNNYSRRVFICRDSD